MKNPLFLRSVQSEWLKTKRTAGSWLVVLGALFIPVIFIAARIFDNDGLPLMMRSPVMWNKLLHDCWQFMAIFLLPMGAVLLTSLITQNEFRNNTWKQLHVTPQPYAVIFLAKLVVILILLAQFFLLFNLGIFLAGVVPGMFFTDVHYPEQSFPFQLFAATTWKYFICCLPVVGLQYLLSLQIRNFLIPLGAGIALVIASLIGASWEYGYVLPYVYCTMSFLADETGMQPAADIRMWAVSYFLIFVSAAYLLYIYRKEKA